MYLKYIRNKRLWGQMQRGTLYCVHFQPNVRGRYKAILRPICDVYEVCLGTPLPLALIYPASAVQIDGRYRLTFGMPSRRSMLHLIDFYARERFFMELICALHDHEEVRIEVAEY